MKTYFAAEQAFMHLISTALLLETVAVILFSIAVKEQNDTVFATEIILTTIAIILTLDDFVVYYRRLYLLQSSRPYGYADYAGPVGLTMAVAGGISAFPYIAVHLHHPAAISTAAVIPGS